MKKAKVVIEVSGGMVIFTTANKDIDVAIIDHDNFDDSDDGYPDELTWYSPDMLVEDEDLNINNFKD